MDHDVETGLGGDLEMLLEQFRLALLVNRVGGGVAGFLAGQPVVVQPRLAERDDLRVIRQLAQFTPNVFRRRHRFAGMPARDRENVRVRFRQRDRLAAAGQIGSDRDYPGDTRLSRAPNFWA